MKDSAFCNADGDFLLVPQAGSKLVLMPFCIKLIFLEEVTINVLFSQLCIKNWIQDCH